uniref:RNA-directed DNA polymerase homolog n=1 Tax=Nicotiana tabacum TaxID=4097 RepID=A0A1S4CFK4_TOBAC|nr:PREDICTED: RNA-directed DNA polymerase homolog [Nicotiana tabacum]
MIGIPLEIAVHKLSLDPDFPPVRQKKYLITEVRNKFVKEELIRPFNIGSIREVKYLKWLASVVVVPKKNNKFRMSVDYKDLNKVCPMDSFSLLNIDQMIDAIDGQELMSFLDAYSGYNQIKMNPEDQEKTSFITNFGTYCYNVMLFGLENTGATYQRLVNKMFENQLGKIMEVYIDDMIV